ncbi:MAG: hypothetical protein CR997_07855 [Acidobacteria bacterium]|nr:MAG: hypothetical protein CR997_07855 [Acidobacteriota bacterium]
MAESVNKPGIECASLMTAEVIEKLRVEIAASGGSEVFAILSRPGRGQLYSEVTIACRGSKVEVPALLSRTKPGEMTLHNHPSGVLIPSSADMRMAGLFGDEGIGSMIVDNQVTRGYIVVEPFDEGEREPVLAQEIVDVFADNGSLSQMMEHYETRAGQQEMAFVVADSLHKGCISVIEAGTGTGKSLAYLVPALLWAKKNKKRILIATKTIALQEQLLYKDIPIARKVIHDAPQASLIKGRSNYICLRKLRDLNLDQMEFDFGPDMKSIHSELQAISDWVENHPSGDRSELPFQPGVDAWETVQSDSDMCLGSSCPYYQESPFYQSRRLAAKSGILIANQALLFTDLALRAATGNYKASAVIPPYLSIIMDEAHSIEDIATSHFGKRVSSFGARKMIGKFISMRRNTGLLEQLAKRSKRFNLMDLVSELEERAIEVQLVRDEFIYKLDEFSELLHHQFNQAGKRKCQVHLDRAILSSEELEPLRKAAQEVAALIVHLSSLLTAILERAINALEHKMDVMEGFFIEYKARLSRLIDLSPVFKSFASKEKKEQVQWLNLIVWKNQRREFDYQISPIDVSSLLVGALYKPFHSLVATSASLNLKDEFKFYQARSGIDQVKQKEIEFHQFASPFPLSRLASLIIPDHFPSPSSSKYAFFLRDLIHESAKWGNGGTLVLFTSYALLYQMVTLCEEMLGNDGVPLFVQGRDQRSALVERLVSTRGVLFGTDTYWEGIDLKGDSLTKLIVTKLPFRQIRDPVFEARSVRIKNQGGNDFKEYALPLALLKFKQGVGRLVRSQTDTGVVIVADNRIVHKYYGKKFLDMAAEFPKIRISSMDELKSAFEEHRL